MAMLSDLGRKQFAAYAPKAKAKPKADKTKPKPAKPPARKT